MPAEYTVACYYFPNYHVDPRNEKVHGAGWTEWELMRYAAPRWSGHKQPRTPLWGFEDEADPNVMARKIGAAADHGIDAFIFDWYWYNDGSFLQGALDRGFLGADNAGRMRFALMWANHDWTDIHPARLSDAGAAARILYPGAVTRPTFNVITDHVVEHYFRHPAYWLVEGCPYFSIYDLGMFIDGLGGIEPAREALAHMRNRVRAAGFPDLHLNAVIRMSGILPGEVILTKARELLKTLGFDSCTSYVWVHHGVLSEFPETRYDTARDRYFADWDRFAGQTDLPYHPNVTMGWDPTPRTVASDVYRNGGYPFTPTLAGGTPAAFREALQLVRDRDAARGSSQRIITINAWNEWTEGSYLEPDRIDGFAYLEAVRAVFGKSRAGV